MMQIITWLSPVHSSVVKYTLCSKQNVAPGPSRDKFYTTIGIQFDVFVETKRVTCLVKGLGVMVTSNFNFLQVYYAEEKEWLKVQAAEWGTYLSPCFQNNGYTTIVYYQC